MQYKYTKLTQDKWRINTKQKRTISLCRLDIKQEVPLHRGKHESSNLNFFKPKHWEYGPHTIAPGIKRSRKGLPPCSQSFFSKWQLLYLCVKPPLTLENNTGQAFQIHQPTTVKMTFCMVVWVWAMPLI